MAERDVWILGASMTKFGRYPDKDLIDLGADAALAALDDAGVTMADMDVMGAGNLMEAASGVGQRIQKQVGQNGVPVYNVANACATGATAIRTVYMAIKSGEADMGIAVGLEKMGKAGLLGSAPRSDKNVFEPSGRYGSVMSVEGRIGTTLMPGVFAQAGMEYANEHGGVGFEQFAKVAEKNHAHSTLNPLAQYQKQFSLDEVMSAEMMAYPNTLLMCCPTGDGSAALVLVSEEKLQSLSDDQRKRAVKVSASVMTSDPWTETDQVQPDVNTLTRNAANEAYETSGVDPSDLDLVELHDCFATAELIHYDNLGLCKPGEAGKFIEERGPWRDGETPVNVSGGLISKGHPLGATGVANLYEVATHLRGEAGDRQVEDAKVGLTHVIGLGSACAVHVLEKAAV
ncbi:MAG TPA: thiolase family protein [Acidimicrobiia bacterium]|nr:thiolase family protein [Acidimicrobiia bacterium]